MGNTSIRPMIANDKPAVIRILCDTPEFLPYEVTVAEDLIDAYLEDPVTSGYYLRVAELDGAIAGYVCYGNTPMTEATWDLYWIAVDHNKQGHGIGSLLMKQAEDDIKRMHGKLVMVETSGKPDYNKTRQFYDTLDYQCVCRVPDYYAPDDDLVIYSKRLK